MLGLGVPTTDLAKNEWVADTVPNGVRTEPCCAGSHGGGSEQGRFGPRTQTWPDASEDLGWGWPGLGDI